MTTKSKHVHSDLIKAWADGAEVQYRVMSPEGVEIWLDAKTPNWHLDVMYRIKPACLTKKLLVNPPNAYLDDAFNEPNCIAYFDPNPPHKLLKVEVI